MTKEEFEKAQREDAWLFHTNYGLVKVLNTDVGTEMGWARLARGRVLPVRFLNLRLATANDLLKENL